MYLCRGTSFTLAVAPGIRSEWQLVHREMSVPTAEMSELIRILIRIKYFVFCSVK